MDNSKYLALVDLMGKEGADQAREKAAELEADLERAEWLRVKAIAVKATMDSYSGLSECIATGHTSGDGLDAVRWAGDAPVMVADPPITWRGMPLLCHDLDCLEDEWTCKYCGKVNPASAHACGEGVWDGCGAAKPEIGEPPRGALLLSNISREQWEQAIIEREKRMAVPLVISGEMPGPSIHFYPEPDMEVTISHPGRLAGDFELGLAARLLSAFQKAIRGAMSLC